MLENELASIFSTGKMAMKSIFKEEDKTQEKEMNKSVDSPTRKVSITNIVII